MKKIIKLQDLDCAACAGKIEESVKKLDGVMSAQVCFMTQKMTLEVPDNRFGSVLAEAKKLIKRVDSDITVVG